MEVRNYFDVILTRNPNSGEIRHFPRRLLIFAHICESVSRTMLPG